MKIDMKTGQLVLLKESHDPVARKMLADPERGLLVNSIEDNDHSPLTTLKWGEHMVFVREYDHKSWHSSTFSFLRQKTGTFVSLSETLVKIFVVIVT